MNDLFLHDSLDTSPIVSSDRVLYTPTSFANLRFSIFRKLVAYRQNSPIHPLAHICLHTCSFVLNQVSESWTIKEKSIS